MKRHLRIAVAALLVLACVGALLGFAACKDEKQASTITAESEQSFVYDGQVHNVVATLNHEEAQLQYDPQQGFTDIGTYTVTITAPETDNYYAPTPVTVTVHILDPAAIAADELADKILAGVSDFNVGDPLGVDLGVDLSYKPATGEGWGYKLGVKGTLDLENMDNTAFSIALTDTLADEQLFALTFVGEDGALYLNAGGGKYTIQLSELLDALEITAPADTNVTMGTYLSMIIGVLGTNCTASADGNTYTMDFNLKDTLGGALGGIVGSILPENIANAIYSIFGASDWNGFVNALPDLSGKIEVKFADNKLTAVSLKDVAYKQGETNATVQANITPFTISNTAVEVTAPADKDTYEAVELLNFTLNGNIALTTDGVNYVDYDVLVQSDLSLNAIVAGDWEHIGKAYIRLSHICTDDCGSYCSEKYESGEGSVLEVGYDSSVNPTSAYIVAGMRNLLGTEAMKVFAGDFMGSMASGVIPEYTAITADLPGLFAQAVGFPATGETPSDPGTGDTGSSIDLGAILGAVNIGENASGNLEIKIDIASLMTTLGVDEGTMNTIGVIFGDPDKEFAMDGAAISVSGLRFFRTEVAGGDDMLNTLIKVKDATVEGDKVFTSEGALGSIGVSAGLAESAKTWEIVNLSDSNVPDMYTDLDLSMLTVYEAQTQLIGNEVYFNVTTLDGQTRENVPAKIWGVSGIDWNLIGQPQEVQLLVSVPQTIINGTVTDALAATVNVYELFKTSVPVTITLAEASDFELVMGENFGDGNYDLLETLPADFASATLKYTKTAGDKTVEGSVSINPVNDLSKYLWTPYASNYSDYITVNGAGIEKNVPMAINPGTATLQYEAFGQTFTKDITISDPYTEKSMTMAKNTATVGSTIGSNDLTFTLNKADGTADTVVIKASSRYINTGGILSFPEGMTVSDGSDTDVTIYSTYWRYNTFPGTIDQQSVITEVYFDIFGEHFVQQITLTNDDTSYKVTAGTPQVNGLTATLEVTITNGYVGWGQDFDGTIAIRKYFSGSDLEAEDVTVTADSFRVANDLGGNSLTVTVTLTANKAGTGKFYIDLMNGDTRVAYASAVTIEFTDPAAEA